MLILNQPKRVDHLTLLLHRNLFKIQMSLIGCLHSGVAVVLKTENRKYREYIVENNIDKIVDFV